jgi:hypothetical protein
LPPSGINISRAKVGLWREPPVRTYNRKTLLTAAAAAAAAAAADFVGFYLYQTSTFV